MTKKTEPSEQSEATDTVSVPKAQLDALLARIEALEKRDPQDIEISTDLPQAQDLPPGSYVNIAHPNQAPDLRKIRWTKTKIEQTYPSVEFIPLINLIVAPHGIVWNLTEGQRVTVPSIVRDFHDKEVDRIRHQYDRYKPESPMEVLEAIQRAKENPGQPVWGRVHIVGHGLVMGEPQTETKA